MRQQKAKAMKKFLAISAALGLLAACGSTPDPDSKSSKSNGSTNTDVTKPCVGWIKWSSGSTPPPYSSRWTLVLSADGAKASFSHGPSYGEKPTFEAKEFSVDARKSQALCKALRDVPAELNPKVGGPTMEWKVTGASGGAIDDNFGPAYKAALKIIGSQRLDEAKSKFSQWADEYKKSREASPHT